MPIRVLLVEDSAVALIILKRILSTSPEITIVGTARTGKEALTLVPTVQPDVICTDFHMPQMNGLEFIQEVMVLYPRPVLVISASVQSDDTQNVFQLLNAGAVDVFPKPKTGLASDYELIGRELIQKIKVLAGVKVFTKHRKSQPPVSDNRPSTTAPAPVNRKPFRLLTYPGRVNPRRFRPHLLKRLRFWRLVLRRVAPKPYIQF